MEVGDIHVGKQLACVFTPQGLNPTASVNPFNLADGSVCGTAHFNGGVLVGSGKFFPPAQPLATTMLTRPSPDENPRATAPSILYIRNSIPPVPTPIDVVVGDEAGPVGVKMVCSMITVTTAGISVELAPLKKSTIGLKKNTGVKSNTGAKQETGVQSQAGAEVRASAKAMAGPMSVSGGTKTPFVSGKIFTGKAMGNKPFDLAHPIQKGKRVRHICAEGPEPAIYIRGKLEGEHIIKLPDYWKGLVDYDTITVNLTPFGRRDNLYVKDIQEDRIIVAGDYLANVNCFYQVWVARWLNPDNHADKHHVVSDGESPANYPGDNNHFSFSLPPGYHE